MRSEPEVLNLPKQWAAQRANVRTVILTSSRANLRLPPDVLSDYDVELFMRDVRPFTEDEESRFAWFPVGCYHFYLTDAASARELLTTIIPEIEHESL